MNHMNQPVSPDHVGHAHDHKHEHSHDHAHDHADHDHASPAPAHGSCCSGAAAPALVQLRETTSSDARLSRFRIEAMDCPTEQTLIQNKLGKLAGVQALVGPGAVAFFTGLAGTVLAYALATWHLALRLGPNAPILLARGIPHELLKEMAVLGIEPNAQNLPGAEHLRQADRCKPVQGPRGISAP